MNESFNPIEMIKVVATRLGELRNEVTFIEGATSILYIEKDYAELVRPTDDVDCIVKVVSKSHYYELEKSLRLLGFENDMSANIICRWRVDNVLVDIMPVDPGIIGFSNTWYEEGFNNRIKVSLSDSLDIHIVNAVWFSVF